MKKDFYEFCKIIEKLRAPGGCPWDREQTHKSLSKHLLEEAYEAYDAIIDEDSHHTMDELGDVLLQIVMHAQIAKEEGEYTIDDITDNVAQKMIDRHPHIFSDTVVSNSEEVLDNWEEIKRKERGQKKTWESLSDITQSLPALMKSIKVINKAQKGGMLPEIGKNRFLKDDSDITKDNLGECLFEICRVAQAKNLDPEAELGLFLKNFTKKVQKLEENT